MAESAYDCIVIGSGPGGYVAAIRAAQLGLRTAVVERDKVGGRCLNYACIPAKSVLRSADLLGEVRDAAEFGLRVAGVEVDYPAVQARRERVVSTLTGGVRTLFKKNGIELIDGEASLAPSRASETAAVALGVQAAAAGTGASGAGSGDSAPGNGAAQAPSADGGGAGAVNGEASVRVRVGDNELSARAVLLATGSVPRGIPGAPLGGRVLGTEEAWALAELPRRLAVVGCGASGAEIASGFARLGSEVILLEALERLLPAEDADISRLVERGFRQQQIEVHTATPIDAVAVTEQSVTISFGGAEHEVDYLVIATGRGPDVEGLGLSEAGVEVDSRGFVSVDGRMRTSARGVYAIGDLVPGPALAHKASDEGIIAVEDAAGLATHPISYVDIPRATFCTPNVGSFGLTEAQAKEQGYDVVVGKVPYGAVGGGAVYGDRTGLVKIVGERGYGELLGGHIVGMRATELIQELVNVRALEGGHGEVARIIHGHPTLSEAVMEAARAADGWLIHG
jgi:dihydrolipoamide dehydrogenase